MDVVFWTGLLLGAVFGLVGSILGNLWTDAARSYLDRRKRIRLSNKKSNEVRTYYFVKALREGNPTATVLFAIDRTNSIRSVIFMFMSFVGLWIILALGLVPAARDSRFAIAALASVFGVMFSFFAFYTSSLNLHVIRIKYRLKRFSEYETSVRVKWGDDALEGWNGEP